MATSLPTARCCRAVADGDAGALRKLHERHAPWLSIRLLRRCNDPELVAEVLQDTFVAAWKGAGKFRADGDVGAWLWGIGIRRLISSLRKRPASADVELADGTSVRRRVSKRRCCSPLSTATLGWPCSRCRRSFAQ